MPTFHIEMFEGRSADQKRKLVEEVTRVTCETLGCGPGAVDIIIAEVKREHWATGGVLWSEQK
ncbi:4-oxalocrotonate tautomerase [Ralstonia pseudosolanacearum]|uniref:Tautomerase n=1 Tax=Ralstonia solanacearum TaxID=305 RepID=A0AA92JTG2_RALSL|nr:4-oxalocrotonate tautomerase [Ralstonia pseudosolanacearum]QOK92514.1 4-oxalocrotonate tautomerase [Ralstonia pseudosolanacearum]QOK97409.1 4-oxalocrotonate tautomerase [Ralstonia pseudosolanacearum]UWD90176.1 4-oxalocrotonate tautomerase [Ralstonia pseudosolanacearum]CAH0441903.1 2-hydroxymuconate tautomerase [Ralstonia pseudosolanacearum]